MRLLPPALAAFCLALPMIISAAEWKTQSVPPDAAMNADAPAMWYRAYLRVPDKIVVGAKDGKDLWRESMTFTLQEIPGPFRVTLNGQTVIEGKDISAEQPRRFKMPKDILQSKVFNVLAIRLEGAAAKQGLTKAPVFGGYLDELLMDSPWEMTAEEPGADDFTPLPEPPAVAAYTEKQWRRAVTVMGPAGELTRGKYVSPKEALAALSTDDDLIVEDLLHEPEIAQPTHVSYDTRGRMWVSQYRQYPYPAGLKMVSRDMYYRSRYDRVPPAPPYQDKGADIISVHEDCDGDGVYETTKQALTGLNMANACVRGHGGIWVMNTPYLMFYPDADGDEVPDRDPEMRLQGFGLEDTHSTANGLIWGPDGWLYGAQGSTVTSHISRPDVDKPGAKPLYLEGCGVWRYHPEKKIFEIFADGGGNIFGLHFDAEGRLFSGHNGGETRGWHQIQEGLYLKQGTSPDKFGPPTNPFAFGELREMKSSHPIPRFTHNVITIQGSAMPERLRGRLLGADPLHHYLVATDRREAGSTFETTDLGFPLKTDDLTFRPVYLTNAPDGSVTVADFREEYIAHGQNYQSQIDPDTGRIYRLRGRAEPLNHDTNLAAKTSDQLVAMLEHANQWHRHAAVQLLAERRDEKTVPLLKAMLQKEDTHPALEALWTLHQMGQLDEALASTTLKHPAPMVRAWTVRLMGDAKTLSPAFHAQVLAAAATEPNAEVRCQMTSTTKRLPVGQALPLVTALLNRSEDAGDAFIPLMLWITLEAHCADSRDAVMALLDDKALWALPLVRQRVVPNLMRRFAASGTRQEMLACAKLLQAAPAEEDRKALLTGFELAFKGRAMPPLPDELLAALAAGGQGSLVLRIRQNDASAVDEALKIITDARAKPEDRLLYVRAFGEVKQAKAMPVLLALALGETAADLRKAALSSLLLYDDAGIGGNIASKYANLPPETQGAALNLLTSRATWSEPLLKAVAEGGIPMTAISPDVLSRLRQHKSASLAALLTKQFPLETPQARESLRPRVEQVRAVLGKKAGNAYEGEELYMQRCSACHTLFFKGGKIGPNLTAYQREDLGTLLVSVVDPNAEIREGFTNYLITTKDGRALSGFLADQDANVVVLRGFDGQDIPLQRDQIAEMQAMGRSLMPEGLLEGLTDKQLQDFFAYLRISQPISK